MPHLAATARRAAPAIGSSIGALLGGAIGAWLTDGWVFAACAFVGAVLGCLAGVLLRRRRAASHEREVAQGAGAAGGALAGAAIGTIGGPAGIVAGSAIGAAIGEKAGRGIADRQRLGDDSPKAERELTEAAAAAGGAVAGAALGSIAGPAGAAAGARIGAAVGHEAGKGLAQRTAAQSNDAPEHSMSASITDR